MSRYLLFLYLNGLHGYHGHDIYRSNGRTLEVLFLCHLWYCCRCHHLPYFLETGYGARLGCLNWKHVRTRSWSCRLCRFFSVHMTGVAGSGGCGINRSPRVGKYNKDGSPNAIPGHNIPMAIVGCFILAFGWFGFNRALHWPW